MRSPKLKLNLKLSTNPPTKKFTSDLLLKKFSVVDCLALLKDSLPMRSMAFYMEMECLLSEKGLSISVSKKSVKRTLQRTVNLLILSMMNVLLYSEMLTRRLCKLKNSRKLLLKSKRLKKMLSMLLLLVVSLLMDNLKL